MNSRAEVIKQPVTVVVATFAVLLGVSVVRASMLPYLCETSGIDHSPVAALIDSAFVGHEIWATVCSTILAVFTAAILTRIITRYSVTVVKTLIPAVLVILLCYSIFFVIRFPSVGLLFFSIARSSELIVGSFRREASYGNVASSGFWLGIAVLIYPPAVVFVVLAPLILLIYKRSPREILTALLFFCVPVILCGFGWWFAGAEPFALVKGLADGFMECTGGFDHSIFSEPNVVTLAFAGIMALLVIAATAVFVIDSGGMRLRVRNINFQFLLMTIGALAMLLSGGNPAITLPITGMCCVPVLNNFFVRHSGAVGITAYVIICLGSLAGIIVGICAR